MPRYIMYISTYIYEKGKQILYVHLHVMHLSSHLDIIELSFVVVEKKNVQSYLYFFSLPATFQIDASHTFLESLINSSQDYYRKMTVTSAQENRDSSNSAESLVLFLCELYQVVSALYVSNGAVSPSRAELRPAQLLYSQTDLVSKRNWPPSGHS